MRAAAEAACNAAAMQRDACDEDDTVLRARFDGVRCAFAAALAQQLDAAVLTGDPDFQRLEGPVAVEWLTG